jgi:outer membrane biosynthesis protein TonB
MKRCPQCEFIYEDDQNLCDMDGVLLVFDSRTLPNSHALATVSAPMRDKAPRRSRMVPAFATLILMVLIASVYYFTTVRSSKVQPELSPANVTAAPAEPQPEAAVVVPQPTPEPKEKAETHPATAPKPAPVPAKKAVATPAATPKPESKKDESKVGSILKKTGKILKKPFKF